MDVVALSPLHLLLIGEDPGRTAELGRLLSEAEHPWGGFSLRSARQLEEAERLLREAPPDLVLVDLALSRSEDRIALRALLAATGELPVVVVSRDDDEEAALEAVRLGAHEVLPAGALDARGLLRAIRMALTRSSSGQADEPARDERSPRPRFGGPEGGLLARVEAGQPVELEGIVSAHPAMRELLAALQRIASTPATVLIQGESGTGKELAARAIHRLSGRKGSFVALDCSALGSRGAAELFLSQGDPAELAPFREARGGTLLLDEVGSLPLAAQHELLRALQAQTGHTGAPDRSLDVRVVAASSAPLIELVRAGRFRQDLLYRLDVVSLELPPLRDRPEDVVHLFRRFARDLSARYELEPPAAGEGFLEAMLAHPWPGNVRQLENLVERLVLTRAPSDTARDFHALVRPHHAPRAPLSPAEPQPAGSSLDLSLTLVEFLDRQERLYMQALLGETGGAVQAAAARAAVNRRTILRKLRKHGLSRSEFL